MFAAMIFALTMLHVPIGAGGYIHVGDSVIYIAALLMGGPWSFISAAIGAACADLVSGVAVYAIPSAIIKVLIAVPRLFSYGSCCIQSRRGSRSAGKRHSGGGQRRCVCYSCFCA